MACIKKNIENSDRRKKKKEAIKFLESTYKKIENPTLYETYDYAYFLKNNEKFNDSLGYYTKVINSIDEKHELYAPATDGRGIVYEQLGQWNKAEKDFLLMLALNQGFTDRFQSVDPWSRSDELNKKSFLVVPICKHYFGN